MNVIVRRLGSDDSDLALRAISRLKQADWSDEGGQPESLTASHLGSFLERDDQYLLVATENDAPVGYLLAYELQRVDRAGTMMFFYEIEVAGAYRRQGIGAALVDALKSICRDRKVMKMWVETNESNESAMRLYCSTGGIRVDEDDVVQFSWSREMF